MGLETYGFQVKFTNLPKRDCIIEEFSKLGFYKSGENLGDIYLEKGYEYGYVEIALQNSELHRKALNEYVLQKNREDLVETQLAKDKESMFVRIAKPNHENIIDCFITDLRAFSENIPISVFNLQSKEIVDLHDYGNLKEHFKNTRDEFKKYYPKPTYPIRCNDVFKSSD